jgi:hypothetical protein
MSHVYHFDNEVDNLLQYVVDNFQSFMQSRYFSSSSGALMTHKYRGCIVVLLINKSAEPNEEQKVLTSGFDQGFTVNTSKRVFRGIW